jgi:hypothetical protein
MNTLYNEEENPMPAATTYRNQLLTELDALPDEYLPFVLQMMRSFRESIALKPAADSCRQGWHEAQQGDTYPVASLWEDIDAE